MISGVTSWAIVEAPSSLGLRATGVRRLPDALLGAGLADELPGSVRRAARVEPGPDGGDAVDEATGLLHGRALAIYSRALAGEVETVLDSGDIPLVLGGDCSILLGCLLGARRAGRIGLLFVDGHADFYDVDSEPGGEVASMELALATGRGPALLAELGGEDVLVRDEDVVAVGFRDHEEQRRDRSPPLPAAVLALDLPIVRERGIDAVAVEALARLTRPGIDGVWMHLDADVVADDLMPAVDYRLRGGFSWAELSALLQAVQATGRLIGLDVTILNPDLDPEGEAARGLVGALSHGLRPPP
jgi:arginase